MDQLSEIRNLALDLTWTWEPRIQRLFQALDAGIWDETSHNPMAVIRALGEAGVREALQRTDVSIALATAIDAHREHVQAGPAASPDGARIGYLSLEFGLTDCLPIFSGGLGVLAADHLKAASDLRLPLVAVGLFYHQGFGRQRINQAGEQVEQYAFNHPELLPLEIVRRDGDPLQIIVPMGREQAHVKVWKVQVGNVPLFLLDTAIETNPPHLRAICDRLYVPEPDSRLRQEIVLGIGGIRALRELDLEPSVCHLNEGHSFLAALELARDALLDRRGNLAEALSQARGGMVFTTHTPVAAGSDYFPAELVGDLLGPYLAELGVEVEEFNGLGRFHPGDGEEKFCTTVAALRAADRVVGVSRLHGVVSRHLWKETWRGLDENQVPIASVTNGVHMPTWVAPGIAGLLSRYVDRRWFDLDPDDPAWERVNEIPDKELWEAHETLRHRLVVLAQVRSNSPGMMRRDILTIGFGRRFAQYKRADLLLRDPERLHGILNTRGAEIQVIFSGKAHPADDGGKGILREIVAFSRTEPRVSFLEDYNLDLARILVQGADLWLNTPRRLLEASGTSGMKAGANGVLNLSVNDGWWDEAHSPRIGWAILSDADVESPDVDDEADAEQLYRLLEEEVAPAFYDRDDEGLPRRWIAMMRRSIRETVTRFSARRMVLEYQREHYAPLAAGGGRRATRRVDLAG